MTIEREGKMGNRDLHLFFLIDASDSMGYGGKVETLNNAIREAIPHIREIARDAEGRMSLIRSPSDKNSARYIINK